MPGVTNWIAISLASRSLGTRPRRRTLVPRLRLGTPCLAGSARAMARRSLEEGAFRGGASERVREGGVPRRSLGTSARRAEVRAAAPSFGSNRLNSW